MQRPYFQIKSFSQVLGLGPGHIVLEDTVQPTAMPYSQFSVGQQTAVRYCHSFATDLS